MTAFSVGQRRREIGIRMAIGATRRQVTWLVIGQGFRPVGAGLLAGLVMALIAAPVFENLLFGGVKARDPLAFAIAAGVLACAATAGMFLPARRAAQVDPATVLRE